MNGLSAFLVSTATLVVVVVASYASAAWLARRHKRKTRAASEPKLQEYRDKSDALEAIASKIDTRTASLRAKQQEISRSALACRTA